MKILWRTNTSYNGPPSPHRPLWSEFTVYEADHNQGVVLRVEAKLTGDDGTLATAYDTTNEIYMSYSELKRLTDMLKTKMESTK